MRTFLPNCQCADSVLRENVNWKYSVDDIELKISNYLVSTSASEYYFW